MSKATDHDNAAAMRTALAGEIALGLVAGNEAKAELERDPLLAAEVRHWSDEFATLSLEAPAVPPDPRVLQRLQTALVDDLVSSDRQPFAQSYPNLPERSAGMLQSLVFWRGMAAAGFAVAATVLIAVLLQPSIPSPSPARQDVATVPSQRVLLVSQIMPRDGPPEYVATYDGDRGRLIIVPASTLPSRAGVPFLWLVPNDDGDPIGLGPLDPLKPVNLDLTGDMLRFANLMAGLVITLEPVPVAQGGTAQGPVIAHGKFSSH